MQWSLIVLVLMGQCSFFMCHLHEYHFVEERKTWTEAQKYCREHYTDLATVSNMTDMERLRDSAQSQGGAWIGLYSDTDANRMWQWSLPGLEYDESKSSWDKDEPQDKKKNKNCVWMEDEKWASTSCNKEEKFVCYDERRKSNKRFHLIEDEMSWPQAQNYCREHHTDLVSGDQQLEDGEFKKETSDEEVWIGLFRDSWRWSDGSSFSFRYWDPKFNDDSGSERCAVTLLDDGGRWRDEDCDKKKPFFCYDDKVILIKQSKKWEEALNYCRENHRDLVSITNPHQQRWVQERAKQADTHVWLGLRYTCVMDLWFWVNDNVVCYQKWAPEVKTESCDMAAAMSREGEHEWFKTVDSETFNFICTVK